MRNGLVFLNVTQFLDALNENLFKYIAIYFLIYYKGIEGSSTIMALTGAIFVAPFILFSSFGGILADRYCKASVIKATRIAQLLFTGLAFFCTLFPVGDWMYLLLFSIAVLSALFGPSKYGIIPDLVKKEDLVKANAYVAAFTYWGIIFGTAIASFLAAISGQSFPLMMLFCVGFAGLGIVFSAMIPKIPSIQPEKPIPLFFYKELKESIDDMRRIGGMTVSVFCFAYFLFMAAYVQMNMIPYSISILHLSPIIGGYLFLFTSIGVGVGSLIASKMKGDIEYIPLYGLGLSLGCFLFTFFPAPFWLSIFWLIIVGVFGGLFLVPAQTYILAHSKAENKGRNFATANFFSFVAAMVAAFVLYLINSLMKVDPAKSFSWIAVLNLFFSAGIFFWIRSSLKREKDLS